MSGSDGRLLWVFDKEHTAQSDLMSVYAGQFIHDIDGDGVSDILAVHGGDEYSDPGW